MAHGCVTREKPIPMYLPTGPHPNVRLHGSSALRGAGANQRASPPMLTVSSWSQIKATSSRRCSGTPCPLRKSLSFVGRSRQVGRKRSPSRRRLALPTRTNRFTEQRATQTSCRMLSPQTEAWNALLVAVRWTDVRVAHSISARGTRHF